MSKIRVLLTDDQDMIRTRLTTILNHQHLNGATKRVSGST
jgi:hypothetical protein